MGFGHSRALYPAGGGKGSAARKASPRMPSLGMLEQPASMAETATAKTFERTDMTDLSRLQDFNIQQAIGGELKTKELTFLNH